MIAMRANSGKVRQPPICVDLEQIFPGNICRELSALAALILPVFLFYLRKTKKLDGRKKRNQNTLYCSCGSRLFFFFLRGWLSVFLVQSRYQ
jgi:hypothetical protein